MDLPTSLKDIDNTPVKLLDIMIYSYNFTLYKEIVIGHTDTNKLKLVYYPLLADHKSANHLHSRTRVLSGSKYPYKGIIIGNFNDLPPLEWINKIQHQGIKELLLKVRNERRDIYPN